MIEATSNDTFDHKIESEFRELDVSLQTIYAIVSVATAFGFALTIDEILLALGDSTNEELNRIRGLIATHLLVEGNPGEIRVRHRVIAEKTVDYLKETGQLGECLSRLLWAVATKLTPDTQRHSRVSRLVRRLLSHDFMIRSNIGTETIREAYASVEAILGWDFHYWLQRGSFETEVGDIGLAKNFLDQARAIQPDDYMVQTEWAYMTLKRAASNPTASDAVENADAALGELQTAVERRGRTDSYPYHVLGAQGLRWVRRAPLSSDQRCELCGSLWKRVKEGCERHPDEADLKQLEEDLGREYLSYAVSKGR